LQARNNREQISFAGGEVSVKWSRRRSIGLTVSAEGQVSISAPLGASKKMLLGILTKNQSWIKRKVAERLESWDRFQKGAVFYLGGTYRLTLDPEAAVPVALDPEEIRVRAAAADAAWPLLEAWYRGEAERLLRERVNHYARTMSLEVLRVELRQWKRRWGECRPREDLRFNWRLILLPPDLLDYVVVHELAHLREPGHTPNFWERVGQVLPDYRQRRLWLNRYGSPFLLWRLGGEGS
jgi:predicted metal-dependent hydrolase